MRHQDAKPESLQDATIASRVIWLKAKGNKKRSACMIFAFFSHVFSLLLWLQSLSSLFFNGFFLKMLAILLEFG